MQLKFYDKIRLPVFIFHATNNACSSDLKKTYEQP